MNKKRFRKRALAVAAATVTTAAALSLGMGGTTNAGTFSLGDVNLDGKVDLKDAQLALKGALRISDLSDMQFKAADVNLDNKVDLIDTKKILRGALNIEKIEGEISDTTPTTPPITAEKPETPIESTVPTIQPIESSDYGIEGVDWKWETKWGMHTYCHCGKLIDVNEDGFLIVSDVPLTSGSDYDKHCKESQKAILEICEQARINGASSEEVMQLYTSSMKCGGWVTKYTTETYKVRLK